MSEKKDIKGSAKDILKKQYAPMDTTHKPVYTPDLTIEEKQELLKQYGAIVTDDKGKEHVNAPSVGNLIFHGMDLHFLTIIDNEDVFRYDGECYINDGQQITNGLTEHFLAELSSAKIKMEVYGHIRDKAFFQRDIFSPPLNLINFKNGILDIETGILYPHTHKQYFLTSIPHNYNPGAKCPNTAKFIKQVAYPSDISTLQEFIGYCFFRGIPLHKACMLVGSGRNGKSTLLQVIKTMLGEKNISTRELQALQEDKFAKVSLFGMLANIAGDISDVELEQTGAFKSLTGGDMVTGEAKYHGAFGFVNHAKLFFSANTPPRSKDNSYAYYARWIWISLPNTFEGKNCNTNLLQELTTDDEIEGLILWALQGLKRLLLKREFSYNKTVEEVKEVIKIMTDPVYAFCNKYIEPWITDGILKKDVLDKYKTWCKDNTMPRVADNMFTGELIRNMPDVTTGTMTVKGKPIPAYRNLKWKEQKKLDGAE